MAITDKQKKDEEQEIEVIVEELPPVRHVVRTISRYGLDDEENNPPQYNSQQTIETTLANYYAQGYRLFNTHFVLRDDVGYGILYILVRG